MLTPQKAIHYERFEFSKWEGYDAETIVEAPVSLTINGTAWLSFMCTPVNLEALAVGFLYDEGVINSMSEVADVRVCEHGDNVDVWLNRSVEQPASWRRTSGCTGGVTAVDLLAKPDLAFDPHVPKFAPDASGHLVEMLFESQELSRETVGVHTSA